MPNDFCVYVTPSNDGEVSEWYRNHYDEPDNAIRSMATKLVNDALARARLGRSDVTGQIWQPRNLIMTVKDAPSADRFADALMLEAGKGLHEVDDRTGSQPPRLQLRIGIDGGYGNQAQAQEVAGSLARNGESGGGRIFIHNAAYGKLPLPDQDAYGPERESPDRIRYRQRFSSEMRRCFIVSPIGSQASETRERANFVFDHFIKPACADRGFRPVRMDQVWTGEIRAAMFQSLDADPLVLAYLGREASNPNVMLEIGYRLATGHPLVILLEPDTNLLFDLGDRQHVMLEGETNGRRAEEVQLANSRRISVAIEQELREKDAIRAQAAERRRSPHPVATVMLDQGGNGCNRLVDVNEMAGRLLTGRVTSGDLPVSETLSDLASWMPPGQADLFSREQNELIGRLSQRTRPGRDMERIDATVPMFFDTHPDPGYNYRAYLPVVVRHEHVDGQLRLSILYLEVTDAVTVRNGLFTSKLRTDDTLRLVWDLYAASYDTILPKLSFYRSTRDAHVRALSDAGLRTILDVAAGTGNVTMELLGLDKSVTAVDKSTPMLGVLEQKAAMLPKSQRVGLRVIDTSAEDMDLADAAFDGASIMLALFAMNKPAKALAKVLRAIKPGGRLVVTEPTERFDLGVLLGTAKKELEDWGWLPDLQDDWERVERVNRAIDPGKRQFSARNVSRTLQHEGWVEIEEQASYLGQCLTITARKPGP
jgi:ubiquinone/menaquinone biosynthesis C-methylase UbiE